MKAKIFMEDTPQNLERALNSFLSMENVSEIYATTPISQDEMYGILVLYQAPPKVWDSKKEESE